MTTPLKIAPRPYPLWAACGRHPGSGSPRFEHDPDTRSVAIRQALRLETPGIQHDDR